MLKVLKIIIFRIVFYIGCDVEEHVWRHDSLVLSYNP